MTETSRRDDQIDRSAKRRFSSLQKALFGVLTFFFAAHLPFWYLEVHVGVSHAVASSGLVLVVVGCFATALALPWLPLPDQRRRTKSERLGAMVIVWVFIALIPRFIWELPWLLFFDQIRDGVQNGALWSYMWSPILLGGDARYLNGDPLIVVLEWVALFVGIFEAYALVQFFRNRRRFTSTQLSLIMAGMIVEVTLPAIYFGVEIANNLESMTSPAEMWIKFVLINVLWCTMPLLTYFWGVRRLARQDLTVTF
ncbi:membrane protein [Nocardia niigatensis]|uniref:membrane protein n=1 Tax=Nocardia niigatensis TaxID=209249 RepID=UPI0002F98DA2|nr:membrane protein [Nocardia niigatensis]